MKSSMNVSLVSGSECAAVSGYYDLSPESPNGSHIVYFAFEDNPLTGRGTGRVTVAARDGSGAAAVGMPITGSSQNGVMQQWIDDDHVAYMAEGGSDASEDDIGTQIAHRTGGEDVRTCPAAIRMFNPVSGKGLGFTRADDHPNWRSVVHLIDFQSGESRQLFTLREAAALHPVARDMAYDDISDFHMKHTKWSPDGSRFFCVMTNENLFRGGNKPDVPRVKAIMLADADGSNLRHHTEFGHHPLWGPDSTYVYAFEHSGGGGQSLVAFPLDGGRKVLVEGLHGVHPSIGPDGRTIVTDRWQPNPGGGFDASVVLIDMASADETIAAEFHMRDIAQATGSHPHPAWSRTGDRVYFNASDDGVVRLYAVDV